MFSGRELVEDQSMPMRQAFLDADACLKWLQEYVALAEAHACHLRLLGHHLACIHAGLDLICCCRLLDSCISLFLISFFALSNDEIDPKLLVSLVDHLVMNDRRTSLPHLLYLFACLRAALVECERHVLSSQSL